ncbi:MAG TPA: glycoside hydrolase family 3 C-terminal domain-containing protein [Acidobacteriaceae bacterium]|nr:glycoside hydrolase family 3 C-terminal domain-containing protein [Acidobacteriaceae bacterium]
MRLFILLLFGGLGLPSLSLAQSHYQYPFQNPNLPTEQRIDNLLSLMTLQEKIDALGTDPDVPRLGVHGSGQIEGLHGVALGGPGGWGRVFPPGVRRGTPGVHPLNKPLETTQFPQEVGLGETWDPALLEQAATEEGIEARYIFQSNGRGGLVIRAPNLNLERDPRWGRSEESMGEDPYFVGTMGTAFVKGLQGNDGRYWRTASLLKHFVAYSNETNRSGSSSNFDARLLHEYYTVGFRMAIEQGGANAYMTSYNAVNGIPMTANPMLKNLTMKKWGFNGIICTDAGALTFMVTAHKYSPNMDEAAAAAIHAGINQFLDKYRPAIEGALQKKLITEADLDENLRGVYRVMIRLGLLDPPSLVPFTSINDKNGPAPWQSDATKQLALHVTEESIVLLKNAKHALPLDMYKLHTIAVIGPRANEVDLDWYSGTPPFTITPLQGIQNYVGSAVKVNYAADNTNGAAVEAAKSSDGAIVFVGNQPTCGMGWGHCPDPTEGKEAFDRKSISLNPEQEKLIEDVYGANPRTIVVLVSSFPYTVNWAQEHVPAILHMAHNSEEEGPAIANALFGKYNPGGRLVVTWPKSTDQLPPLMDYNIRDGRTYMYFKGEPLYPFGYGLSYTRFAYSHLDISSPRLGSEGQVMVSVDVKNDGARAGDEVVQMYVTYPDSKVPRPREQLVGFKRIHLEPDASETVRLPLKAKGLAYWDDAVGHFIVEPGTIKVLIGSSSADIRLQQSIQVAKAQP